MAIDLNKYTVIANVEKSNADLVGFKHTGIIYMAPGVKKHIEKRHSHELNNSILNDLENYIRLIITTPDYVGSHPTKDKGQTMEFIKQLFPNLLVSIAIDIKNDYIYVSSLYPVTDAKLEKGLQLERFKKV